MTISRYENGYFPYFWLAVVFFFGPGQLPWAINDLRVGSARMGWMRARVERTKEPFEFWFAVVSKIFGVIVACGMFYMGLDMLKW